MSTVYVYALCEPDLWQEVRYVGVTSNPHRRFIGHVSGCLREGDSPKAVWLRNLRSLGMKPILLILEQVALSEAHQREQHWILEYQKQGAHLTNAVPAPTTDRTEWGEYQKSGLARLRIKSVVSVGEVAQKLGISPATAYSWERGRTKPKMKHIRQLIEILRVTPDELCDALEEMVKKG